MWEEKPTHSRRNWLLGVLKVKAGKDATLQSAHLNSFDNQCFFIENAYPTFGWSPHTGSICVGHISVWLPTTSSRRSTLSRSNKDESKNECQKDDPDLKIQECEWIQKFHTLENFCFLGWYKSETCRRFHKTLLNFRLILGLRTSPNTAVCRP